MARTRRARSGVAVLRPASCSPRPDHPGYRSGGRTVRTITSQAVWIDADYDKDSASDGKSRYGAYVRDRVSSFAECWDGIYEEALAVHFAATAWQAATGPIMVPGYVRFHRRIRGVQLEHSYWDGSLLASLDLITPWPQQLRESPRWMEQTARESWWAWLMGFG